MTSPKVFISYSRESESHNNWVCMLADSLRKGGIESRIDQWHAVPGDMLAEFMENEIRNNDYVLIICTPTIRLSLIAERVA